MIKTCTQGNETIYVKHKCSVKKWKEYKNVSETIYKNIQKRMKIILNLQQ